MKGTKRYRIVTIMTWVFWVLAGAGTIALLVAAMAKKNSMHCTSVEVNIKGVQNNYFIDEKDVLNIIRQINGGKLEGVPVKDFNLEMMETALQKNTWIKKAELFFDNNEQLKVEVLEREPVARIFTDQGNSFYIDSSVHILPLSDKFSPRLPVFTGFVQTGSITKSDTLLLKDISKLGAYILNDPFWMAQLEQVDIQPGRQFEFIPKVGNQLIVFGNIEDYQDKFQNLLTFYREVLSKDSWNKYSRINVQYRGQVIAVRRGAADQAADSLRTLQMMQAMVVNAQAQANDSISNIQLAAEEQAGINVIQTAERDEHFINADAGGSPFPVSRGYADSVSNVSAPALPLVRQPSRAKAQVVTRVADPVVQKPVRKTIIKPVAIKPAVKKKPVAVKAQPKAVMPAKNEY